MSREQDNFINYAQGLGYGLKTDPLPEVRCAKKFVSGYLRVSNTPDVLLRKSYKHKRDQRKDIKGVALQELCNDLMQDFGIKVFYRSMERLNNSLLK